MSGETGIDKFCPLHVDSSYLESLYNNLFGSDYFVIISINTIIKPANFLTTDFELPFSKKYKPFSFYFISIRFKPKRYTLVKILVCNSYEHQ
jgi:hypothetical protein